MNKAKCVLISPASIFDPKDPFTTGVVYMPIGLAYGASSLQKNNIDVEVIDLFGENPTRAARIGNYVRLGAPDSVLTEKIAVFKPQTVIFYANQVLNHISLIESISTVRKANPNLVIGVAENTQAVTAYFLSEVAEEFFKSGVDFLISGEMEHVIPRIVAQIHESHGLGNLNIDGVSTISRTNNRSSRINNLDELDFPAWEKFPIENYWNLPYAHGPFESERYLPILTSRGCPFPCRFCVVPSTNNRKWRARSAKNVVDEIEFFLNKFQITEFHLEDLNPTIQDERMYQIAKEILDRNLQITWKIVAGTKIESIKSLRTLKLMSKSGLNYLSMSPETGSRKIQRQIGKPFDTRHALKMVRECRKLDVSTQACFVLGFPGESFANRIQSLFLALRLTVSGLDEVVVFIMAPVPGSEFFSQFKGQYESLSDLGFSPRWRRDFLGLLLWRLTIYFSFILLKFLIRPHLLFVQLRNVLFGKFKTKMEMVPIRGIRYSIIALRTSKQA